MTAKPPTRLFDDPDVDARLREDLRASSMHSPIAYDATQGWERLQSQLGGTHVAPDESAPAASGKMGALKWWTLSAVGLAVVSGVWLTQPARSPAPSSAATRAPAAPTTRPPSEPARTVDELGSAARTHHERTTAEPARSGLASPAAQPRPAGSAAHAVSRPKPPAGAAQASAAKRSSVSATSARAVPGLTEDRPASKATDGAQLNEIRQLAEARRALSSDPAHTLRLARTGQREFRHGMFAQERSALIVFALDALGREAEARLEAERYLRHYGDGPFSARVRLVVEGSP